MQRCAQECNSSVDSTTSGQVNPLQGPSAAPFGRAIARSPATARARSSSSVGVSGWPLPAAARLPAGAARASGPRDHDRQRPVFLRPCRCRHYRRCRRARRSRCSRASASDFRNDAIRSLASATSFASPMALRTFNIRSCFSMTLSSDAMWRSALCSGVSAIGHDTAGCACGLMPCRMSFSRGGVRRDQATTPRRNASDPAAIRPGASRHRSRPETPGYRLVSHRSA